MMKRLTLFLLALTVASQGWGQVQMDRINVKGITVDPNGSAATLTFKLPMCMAASGAGADSGASRESAGVFDFGVCSQGDTTGSLRAKAFTANGGSTLGFDINFTTSGKLVGGGSSVLGFTSSNANGTVDTGISRSAAHTLSVGNGNFGDTTGIMQAAQFSALSSGLVSSVFSANVGLSSSGIHGWTATSLGTSSFDTGLSRDAAGIVDIGNGAAGDKSGTLQAANVKLSNLVTLGQTVVGSLPSAASNPGAMILVTDSTAVASEGQTCVGSSTNKAVAVSNGSVWKCF